MKESIKDYFRFNKKQTSGTLILVLILVILLIVKQNLHHIISKDEVEIVYLDSLLKKEVEASDSSKSPNKIPQKTNPITFDFNPNELEKNGWMKLGLSEKQAQSILNYRSKGGLFQVKSDLKKSYVISDEFYQRLESHILLPDSVEAANKPPKVIEREFKKRPPVLVDINSADTIELMQLFGIGSAYSNRIIKYRNALGGFNSTEQLHEVWGLTDSLISSFSKQLYIKDSTLHKLNINQATAEELKLHPYFNWNVANAIVKYRSKHGNFAKIDDLRNIKIIDEEMFKKIKPYLAL